MGMQYRFDQARRLVQVRAWGVVSTANLQDFTSHLLADPRFGGDFRSLTDETVRVFRTSEEAKARLEL